jgi:hypothetical protein
MNHIDKSNFIDIESNYQSLQGCSIPEVELRGISIKQLKTIYAEIEARCVVEAWTDFLGQLLTPEHCNLYDIHKRIIMNRTYRKQCSYIELIATEPQKPTRYVSYWWGLSVISMIRCLEQHCSDHRPSEETSYYWIDVSSCYLHGIMSSLLYYIIYA